MMEKVEKDKPNARKFSAYKLIVDPALVKGALKLYRFDGVIPGDTSSPSIILRDPRKQKNLQRALKPLVLPVPAFEIDKNYVGAIPPTEITLTNLNDNVSETFLRTISSRYGMVEDVRVYFHPISHRHLGFGHVIFESSRDAKTCMERLNGTLVMGQKVNVFRDPGGKMCNELFIKITTQKPGGRMQNIVKSDERGNSHTSVPALPGSSSSASSASSIVKPSSSKSSSKQNHTWNREGHFGNGHHYKDDNTPSPFEGRPYSSSDKQKPSLPIPPPSKGSSSSRDKDRGRDYGYKRANSMYDRSENYNYGYPIQPSSSRSTPSSTSKSSPHSSYHQHHHHYSHSQNHPQTSVPQPSPRMNANSQIGDHHITKWPSGANGANTISTSHKVFEEEELSPKIDLDTRIKMMARHSGEFAKLFKDCNFTASGSESESNVEASPLKKRARLSFGGASTKLWDSDSDEEVGKEVSFAKMFKQSFLPVSDGFQVISSSQRSSSIGKQHQNSMSSTPPSPFLTFTRSSATKSAKEKAGPEFYQISHDEGAQGGAAAGENKDDDMSLTSLSLDDAAGSRIRQSHIYSAPPPGPGQGHSAYYGEYYNSACSSNYQPSAWGSHHYLHSHHQQYQGNYQSGYSGGHTDSAYPPPPIHPHPVKQMEMQKPPIPPQEEDYENPNLLIKSLIKVMVDDLKKVLRRDCNRRLVETEAFKMYENWWDKQASEFKRKQDEEIAKNLPAPSTVPAPAEVIIEDLAGATSAAVNSVPETESISSGLSFGLGLLNAIPKLPSFRRSIIKAPTPAQDEDSRKSFLDSESDSLASNDEKIIRRKSKPRFRFSSSDDDSNCSSFVSSKSSTKEEEDHGNTDAEAISASDDEDEVITYKSPPRLEEDDEDLMHNNTQADTRMELEDILSGDDSPEEPVRVPEQDQEGTFRICSTTGRLLFNKPTTQAATDEEFSAAANRKLLESNSIAAGASLAELTEIRREVEEGEIEEETATSMEMVKSENVSKSNLYADHQPTSMKEAEDDKSLIVPYDATRPRGYKKTSKPVFFRPRLEHERLGPVYEFLQKGIDEEDVRYLQKAYENLLVDDTFNWLNCTHWVGHPETVINKKKKEKQKGQKNDSEEGSLRTRGFVRMTREEKSRAIAGQQPAVLMSYDGALPSENQKPADMGKVRETQIREARSNQRRLLTLLGAESELLKFNQLHFRKKALKFARSGIHDWGLFAAEPIVADEMVIEYVGQQIRPIIADRREAEYENQGIGSSYLFKIDPETIIDATRCGNLARFINHSCNPNCYAKVITVEGEKKLVIYSKQAIAVGEEITYDYKFPIEEKKIPCLCGTLQCRGSLN